MKKKFLKNSIINTLAVALPIILIQFYIMPRMSLIMDVEKYGVTITIISILNFISTRTGNTLNNIRLINNNIYSSEVKNYGDFSILVTLYGFCTSFLVVILSFYCVKLENDYILLFITGLFMLLREYLIALFRIKLEYNKIFITYMLQTIGLLCGWVLYIICKKWLWIYFVGNFVPILYMIYKNRKNKFISFSKSSYFISTFYSELFLFISSILNGFNIYADKLFILPMQGAKNVTIYYVATVIGRFMDMIITPVSSVLLSYLSKEKKIQKRILKNIVWKTIILLILGYITGLFLSPRLLKLLYPQYVNDVIKYLPVTIGSGIINCTYLIINTIVIRFMKIDRQLFISIIGIVIFVITSLILNRYLGLMGFCLGALFASVTKTIIEVLMIRNYLRMEDG